MPAQPLSFLPRHRASVWFVALLCAAACIGGTTAAFGQDESNPSSGADAVSPSLAPFSGQNIAEILRRSAIDQREQREALAEPGAVEEREHSQAAYGDLSRAGALSLVKAEFADALKSASAPPELGSGEHIARYLNPYEAVVNGDGSPELLSSSAPLTTRDASGDQRPVDLNLQTRDGSLQPRNSPIAVALAATAGGGVTFGNDWLKVAPDLPPSSATVTATVTGTKAFYPDVARDSDLLATPTTAGAEFFTQLRSPSSPEAQRFNVELPDGATLTPTPRGVEIGRDGAQLGLIEAPAATDAQGRAVPVSLDASRDAITVTTHHQNGNFAYPILSDPIVNLNGVTAWQEIWSSIGTNDWGTADNTTGQWFPTESIPPSSSLPLGGFLTCPGECTNNVGKVGIYAPSGYAYPYGAWGTWTWPAPKGSSYISRAQFSNVAFTGAANPKAFVIGGVTSPSGWLSYSQIGAPTTTGVLTGTTGTGDTSGEYAMMAQFMADPTGAARSFWVASVTGNMSVLVGDQEKPSVTGITGISDNLSTVPTASTPLTVNVEDGLAGNRGIGIKTITLTLPNGTVRTRTHSCSGVKAGTRCPQTASSNGSGFSGGSFTLAPSDLTLGVNEITATTTDMLGKQSDPFILAVSIGVSDDPTTGTNDIASDPETAPDETGEPNPTLSQAQEAEARSLIENDPAFIAAVGSTNYTLEIGPWTEDTPTGQEIVGATVLAKLDTPRSWPERQWSSIDYGDGFSPSSDYEEGSITASASDVTELMIDVDLRDDDVVQLMPFETVLPDGTTEGDVEQSNTGDADSSDTGGY